MTFYEQELMRIFGDSELLSVDTVSSGKTMISKIGKDIRAKIQFVTSGIAKHYDTIKVSIINRKDGVIDEERFRFSDIIGSKEELQPYIWEYKSDDIDWYGYRLNDKDYVRIQAAVENYVEMYADVEQSQGFEMPFM